MKPSCIISGSNRTQMVPVHHNWILGIWVVVSVVPVLGKYVIIEYLDPYR